MMRAARFFPVAVVALVCVVRIAAAQVPQGRVYVLHSGAGGGCPHLDWHILVEPDDDIAGMISWNEMRTIARATGHVDRSNHTFSLVATELGGKGKKSDGQWHDPR
jgi:hypothetical protein